MKFRRAKKYPHAMIAAARDLARHGVGCGRIAVLLSSEFNRLPSTTWVWRVCRGALAAANPRYSKRIRRRARRLRRQGKTLLQIAVDLRERFGVLPSISWIHKVVNPQGNAS